MKKLLIPAGIIVLGLVWYLASPLFIDRVVNEDFPHADSALTPEEVVMMDHLESLSPEQVRSMPEEKRMAAKKIMEEVSVRLPDAVVQEPMDTTPTMRLSGTFRDGDSAHHGSGTVGVYQLPDGKRIVRLENFSVTNGPALSVYLTKSTDGTPEAGFVNLGKLKGNKGDQNYELSADVSLHDYHSVSIWCVPFGVLFSVAQLEPVQ